jgi:hypothetical protein
MPVWTGAAEQRRVVELAELLARGENAEALEELNQLAHGMYETWLPRV